jgi:polygalacturonase
VKVLSLGSPPPTPTLPSSSLSLSLRAEGRSTRGGDKRNGCSLRMIGTSVAFVFALVCFAGFARADDDRPDPPLPQITQRTFVITSFGATTRASTDVSSSIQKAIDSASAAGGGTVEIPKGQYLSGPVRMASDIDLQLDDGATLKLLPLGKYPGGTRNPQSFISGQGLHDIAITGKGTIDGQGAPWWPLVKKQAYIRRPRMIALSGCNRILIEGVTLQNSPMFHIAISGHSTNVTVRGVTIRAPASTDAKNPSHNTDACDVSGSHVLIENCNVSVGDDDFTCGGGTSDVLIRNCTYGFGHGVSVGSPTGGGVSDITVENCTFKNTECGIRIKSDRGRGGIVQHLTYRNLQMTNVGIPILIYAEYMARAREYRDLLDLTAPIATTYPSREMSSRTPVYRDITFSDITATTAPGQRAGLIWGLPEAPASQILLQNVTITADKPFGIYNAKGVQMENCKIVTPAEKGKSVSLGNAEVTFSWAATGPDVHE